MSDNEYSQHQHQLDQVIHAARLLVWIQLNGIQQGVLPMLQYHRSFQKQDE